MALIRSASDGVRPVVGSVVTSPTVKIPNCMLAPSLARIVQNSTTANDEAARGIPVRRWGSSCAPASPFRSPGPSARPSTAPPPSRPACAPRRAAWRTARAASPRARRRARCSTAVGGSSRSRGSPSAASWRTTLWMAHSGIPVARDNVTSHSARSGLGWLPRRTFRTSIQRRVPDLGQLLGPASHGLLILLLRAEEGLLDLRLVPRVDRRALGRRLADAFELAAPLVGGALQVRDRVASRVLVHASPFGRTAGPHHGASRSPAATPSGPRAGGARSSGHPPTPSAPRARIRRATPWCQPVNRPRIPFLTSVAPLLLPGERAHHDQGAGQRGHEPLQGGSCLCALATLGRRGGRGLGARLRRDVAVGGHLPAQHAAVRRRAERRRGEGVLRRPSSRRPAARPRARSCRPADDAAGEVQPMAAALTGVQRSQPVLATRPVLAWSAACPAAGLSATALASVPPNHAERPTSCSERERVLVDMGSPRVGFTVGGRAIPLGAVGNRPRPARSTGPGSRAQGATSSELRRGRSAASTCGAWMTSRAMSSAACWSWKSSTAASTRSVSPCGGQAGRILEHPEEPVLPEELPAAAGLGHPVGVEQQARRRARGSRWPRAGWCRRPGPPRCRHGRPARTAPVSARTSIGCGWPPSTKVTVTFSAAGP